MTITADNAYSFGYGTINGLSYVYGNVENCTAGQIFNCSGGAETYTNVPSAPSAYLYVVAYSDDAGTQGVLGKFVAGTNTVYTGTTGWQVYATGLDRDPNCAGSPNNPSVATINAEIAKANSNTGGAGSSVGWVGVAGGAIGTVGRLAVGEDNSGSTGTFPIVCTSGSNAIDGAARWMWYNPNPAIYTNPFAAPAPPGEFLIFRLPTVQVTNPQMVGVNKDLQNTTGQTATGVDILVAGHHPSLVDIFHGTTPNFTVVPEGPNDRIRWSGGNIAPLAVIHVGFKLLEPEVTILGVYWTNGTTVIGCAKQCNTHYHLLGTQNVRYENNCVSCLPETLFVGDFRLEYYANEVDLAAMNSTTQRAPLATVILPNAPVAIAPGGFFDLTVPPQPANARWVLLQYTVGSNSTLSGPGNTIDWTQFAAQADVGDSPGIPFCSGDGAASPVTTACPCGNVGLPGNGCANSVNAAGAHLDATGSVSADTVQLTATGLPSTAVSVFLKGDLISPGGYVFGDGVTCVGGALVRLRAVTSTAGTASFPAPPETVTLSFRGGTPVGSGMLAAYTTYYRNAAAAFCPPATFNTTNSYQIVW